MTIFIKEKFWRAFLCLSWFITAVIINKKILTEKFSDAGIEFVRLVILAGGKTKLVLMTVT